MTSNHSQIGGLLISGRGQLYFQVSFAVWIIPVMMHNHYRPLLKESILPGYPASGERDRTFQSHFVHVTTTVPFKAARL